MKKLIISCLFLCAIAGYGQQEDKRFLDLEKRVKELEIIKAKILESRALAKEVINKRKEYYAKNQNVLFENNKVVLILPPDINQWIPYHIESFYTREKGKVWHIRVLTYNTVKGQKKQVSFKVPLAKKRLSVEKQKVVYFY